MQEVKDKLLIAVFLLGVIAVGWLLVWAVQQPSFQRQLDYFTEGIFGDDPTLIEIDPVATEAAAEATVAAIQGRDLVACAALEDAAKTANCEQQVLRLNALDADNSLACKQLVGEQSQKICAAEIYYTRAILGNDPAPCGQIELPDWQATCLARFEVSE